MNLLALATSITIDLMDLLLGLLIIVGILLGVYLIILLARLGGAVKKLSVLVDEIDGPVTETIKDPPGLMKKVDQVADDVSVLTESARTSVPAVLKDVESMTGSVRGGVDAVGGAAKSIGNSFSSFFRPSRSSGDNHIGAIVEIAKQVMAVVGLFTGRQKKSSKRRTRRK